MTDSVSGVIASQLTGTKIEAIAKEVLGKDSLSDDELEFIFDMISEIAPMELSISAAETRQVRQYESNNYHASMKMTVGDIEGIIKQRMLRANPEDRAAVFTECRRMLYAMIGLTYKNNENFLRALITEQEIADGITR